jgi:hypothetical protein
LADYDLHNGRMILGRNRSICNFVL